MFKDFGRRLQRDVNKMINNRIKISAALSGGNIQPEPMKVEVRVSDTHGYLVGDRYLMGDFVQLMDLSIVSTNSFGQSCLIHF